MRMSSKPSGGALAPAGFSFALACLALVAFTGCYKTGKSQSSSGTAAETPTSTIVFEDPPPTVPPSPVESPVEKADCLTSVSSELCLFRKNPVAQTGAPLASDTIAGASLASLQVYSAVLGPALTTTLENSYIRVRRFDSQGLAAPTLKIAYSPERAGDLGLALSFYWYNYAAQNGVPRTGRLALASRKIKLFVDDALTGWSYRKSSIHLGARGTRLGASFDASALVYLMGVANADIAASGALGDGASDLTHVSCAGNSLPQKAKNCCATQAGCSRALLVGTGLYFHAMVFPDATGLAELLAGDPHGFTTCGLERSMSAMKDVMPAQAYNACLGRAAAGQVHVMGALYASILWEIRARAAAMPNGGTQEFDKLYMDHLQQLRSDDTIVTAKTKLLYVDQTFYGGRYQFAIRDEFLRRGL